MASAKELATRLESQRGSATGSARKNMGERRTSGPSSHNPKKSSGLLNTDPASTRVHSDGSVDHLSSRSLLLRRPGHNPHNDVEMRPLGRLPDPSTRVARNSFVTEAMSGAHGLEPLPPIQPARFLRHGVDKDSATKLMAQESIQSCEETNLLDSFSQSSDVFWSATGQSLHSATAIPEYPPKGTGETHPKDHKTIPIAKLFSRNAPPLHLPELDDWLGKLHPFQFTYPKAMHPGSAPKPFPPLDLLKGEKLKDLIHNNPPAPLWRDWNSIGSTDTTSKLVNLALSIMGSSAISTFYSLAGLYNVVQIFVLILNTIVGNSSGRWRTLFLGTIPNVLALNFGGKLLQSILFLGILTAISGCLLFWFHRLTARWSPNATPEGLLSRDPARGTRAVPLVSFALTVLYLPLSTISVHAITWSSDFWPVENPFVGYNGTKTPDLQPLGPSSVFHEPLDFCWTTTMRKDEINYAPAAVVLGVLTLMFMTFWFPIRLGKTIRRSLPVVEPYDALGQRRSEEEMENEYQRFLERDNSPFSFLYNEYRRKWGSFKAFYLGGKLTALLIVAIISPDSCLTLKIAKSHVSRNTLEIARQSILLAVMIVFLLVQSLATPFIDPVSNASEWTSRMNFVLTSLLGLFIALNIPGQAFWNGWALYTVYIITYGLTIYFTVINWSWMHRIIKRLNRRIDFSIDIFSPRLDISPQSRHLQHRIWQESWSTLLLASPQCRMSTSEELRFAEGVEVTSHDPAPPYLLDFSHSPAERHIENVKIMREIGALAYEQAIQESKIHYKRITSLRQKILQHMVGPDAFWFSEGNAGVSCPSAADYFGNAWCLPFPLTVIIRYDTSGALVAIKNLSDIEEFVRQNETRIVEKQRELRIALRCLDSVVVQWPYTHTELVGDRFRWIGGRRYHAYQTTDYHEAKFSIRRHGSLEWKNTNLASGFDVSLRYSKKLTLDGSLIGLNVNLELTSQLARFLLLNKATLESRMPGYLNALREYRTHTLNEVESKLETLSYGFLTNLYALPMDPVSVAHILAQNELNLRVRDLAVGYEHAFQTMDERMRYVGRSPVEAWWFLLWDDFWRRNKSTVKALKTHYLDFNPQYPTSIAYRPLPRPTLEAFLRQRGLWSTSSSWSGNWWWLHTGFINKIYFHLNWVVFAGTSKAIHVHIGDYSSFDLEEVDARSRVASSGLQGKGLNSIKANTSSGLKAGTNHSDSIMRTRRAYRWETLMGEDSTEPFLLRGLNVLRDHRWHFWHEENRNTEEYRISWRGRLSQWFGLSPVGRLHWHTGGLSVEIDDTPQAKENLS
ncbi:unnamed protein product [Rhizoctonia solani]|uniref:Uncharacterized protein n=1 Tax=Rhizoctonia solani TaxID=456999 RepID=A0A8H3H0R3_9AGAM|nr:unnamed protein product [Rhizoctonia solani]